MVMDHSSSRQRVSGYAAIRASILPLALPDLPRWARVTMARSSAAYSAQVIVRAWWDPGWYNLDQSLEVGQRATFVFLRAEPPPDHDVVLANDVGIPGYDRYSWSATIESIDHHRFGSVVEVDTRLFGQYTFTFGDDRWVTIEAEERPGSVNDASRDFPVDDCDPAWASNSGWALTVVVSDVARTPDHD
jgi:hypothetical protein